MNAHINDGRLVAVAHHVEVRYPYMFCITLGIDPV